MPSKGKAHTKTKNRLNVTLATKDPLLSEFKELTPLEQQTITALAVNNNDVVLAARDLDVTPTALYYRLSRNPRIKEYLHNVSVQKPMLRLLQKADELAENLTNLAMEAQSENVKLEATKHALGIVGISPDKKEGSTFNVQLNNIIGQSKQVDDI